MSDLIEILPLVAAILVIGAWAHDTFFKDGK